MFVFYISKVYHIVDKCILQFYVVFSFGWLSYFDASAQTSSPHHYFATRRNNYLEMSRTNQDQKQMVIICMCVYSIVIKLMQSHLQPSICRRPLYYQHTFLLRCSGGHALAALLWFCVPLATFWVDILSAAGASVQGYATSQAGKRIIKEIF